MAFTPDKPYNDLPLLPPTAEIESLPILRQTVKTARAMATLKQAGELIPNQSVLINTVPLLEAKVSSEIENIVTTTDALFQHSFDEARANDPATKEALRYRSALYQGFTDLRQGPITPQTAITICQTILNKPIDVRDGPGTALANALTGETIYTPPCGQERIHQLLNNWEHFINQTHELDPLIRLAVMHYQFEAIHPFEDGNGRTGRILNILYLIQENLLEIPVLYLSRYILRSKHEYYRLLREVTENQAWENWIIYVLKALEETANWTAEKIKVIRALMQHTGEIVKTHLPKSYSHDLVELIFIQPYARITHLTDLGIAKRQTASVYLKQLCEIGVLQETKYGREKIFLHPKFIHLLQAEVNRFADYE